ncbi:MAG: hypothetical protein HETSPECPRED_002299 [Heterodermia speciosa]|uniref:Uncharacterized protein n=1 Tax=Heterodermia speciosa TaxID=116794 RepID=A0A8H3IBY2_9LECA|nr:MAG: hypothetical protein HETSPECPRED_002299 [Heterodermia speciosa]
MLNEAQAQRGVSSRDPTRRVLSAGDMQQRSQRSRFDGLVEQVPHQPTALTWDVQEPTSNAFQDYPTRQLTHLASNEALYGQWHQQQTPPNPSPWLHCPHLSPVSPCERGSAMSEEQRNRLLRSMPGYQSSSSPMAEPTLLHEQSAPGKEWRSSIDAGSTGDGKSDWGFMDVVAENSSPFSDNRNMINPSFDYQGENPFPNGSPAISNCVGQRPGSFPRDEELEENDQDVELLTELLQDQKLTGEEEHPGYIFSEM